MTARGRVTLALITGAPKSPVNRNDALRQANFEICRRVKSHPETASIRVLPFTAVFRNDADRKRAFDVGADGYLVRPVPAADLVASVNGLIGVA